MTIHSIYKYTSIQQAFLAALVTLLNNVHGDVMSRAYMEGLQLTLAQTTGVELKRVAGIGIETQDMYNLCHAVRMTGYQSEWSELPGPGLTEDEVEEYRRRMRSSTIEDALGQAMREGGAFVRTLAYLA